MAFTRIDHIGILVPDLETAKQVYVDGMGLSIDEHRSPWPQGRPGTFDGVTSVDVQIGEMYLEISKPNSPDTPAGQFVAGRSGMYYISLASTDIAADLGMLQSRGVKLEGNGRTNGPLFLDPETTQGLRIQITREQNYYVHPFYRGEGLITGMAHVGVACRSAEEARHLWADVFGLREDKSMERGLEPAQDRDPNRAAGDPVHLLEFPIGGTVLEVSVPTTTESGTARLVAQRAPLVSVYHHICPFAPNVHALMDRAKAAGLQQVGSISPREVNPRATAWLHPRTAAGVLTEVWNRNPGSEHRHGQL
ncbi:MAG: VOC family protein [Chloroflexi bacterium]|nr:VOC family protein [Chloroflexota bacterium]